MKNIATLHKCIGVSGMNGIDKILSFWILKKLRIVQSKMKRGITSTQRSQMEKILNRLKILDNFVKKYKQIHDIVQNLGMKNFF